MTDRNSDQAAADRTPRKDAEPRRREKAPPAERRFIAISGFRIFFVVVCLLAIAGGVYWLHARHFEEHR